MSRHPGGSRTLASCASHGTVIDPHQSRDHDRSSPSWASHGTYTHTTGVVSRVDRKKPRTYTHTTDVVSRVDRKKPPPSLGGLFVGLFQNQEPGGRGALLKKGGLFVCWVVSKPRTWRKRSPPEEQLKIIETRWDCPSEGNLLFLV